MKKVYISIPITGHDINKVKEKANEVKKHLTENGYDAITPFDVCDEKDKPYSYYMGKDIEALLECDVVYMCKGWTLSKGCISEHEIAHIYDKQVIYETTTI